MVNAVTKIITAGADANLTVRNTKISPISIAATMGFKQTYNRLQEFGSSLFPDCESEDSDFVDMLMREFPAENLRIE